MEKPKTVEDAQKNNFDVFMERGPGLDSRYQSFVVAKDLKNKKILLGGLGGMGIGEMWFDMSEKDEARIGYQEAPVVEWKSNK